MKLKLLIFTCTSLITTTICAQKIENIKLEDKLHKPYEFSSIDSYRDTIYLMSETCTSFFKIDKDSGKEFQEISFANPDRSYDIEAYCNYENGFFFADETDNSIYHVSNKSNLLLPHKLLRIESEQNRNRDFGIEGLCLNPEKNILYVIKEFGKNKTSILYCYTILQKENSVSLKLKKRVDISLGNMYRYTDIAFDSQKNSLYLLRTKFKNYSIDVISLNDQSGLPDNNNYKYKNFISYNISSKINSYFEEGYSTNMEGITIDETGKIYLVSDNYTGRDRTCESDEQSDRKTLLLKLTL
ncbi:Esterase-like activity of phytase [Pustulibacterium marinum]|uniref:Esterase-like activity of phytase n=1 Tax=Pustulibacterium marinum TaxID=1224947 RepID=A0A1I7H7J1_9FLAO|nr:esterase-like activity of phytase family protein [Pustulibacterium marinum]SFU56667.1 Esterase-like activity of phytase [Pustulibacterium marinum]